MRDLLEDKNVHKEVQNHQDGTDSELANASNTVVLHISSLNL